jgi:hypothetical protein
LVVSHAAGEFDVEFGQILVDEVINTVWFGYAEVVGSRDYPRSAEITAGRLLSYDLWNSGKMLPMYYKVVFTKFNSSDMESFSVKQVSKSFVQVDEFTVIYLQLKNLLVLV